MSGFQQMIDAELTAKLYARRIPFTAFVMAEKVAMINAMLSSPAGMLTVPFSLEESSDGGFTASSTGGSATFDNINPAIAWIVKQIRRLEIRVGKFTL